MKNLTLKQHWMIGTGLMMVGVIIATFELMQNMLNTNWWVQGIAIAIALVGYLYFRKFVRCPECGAVLRSSMKFPEVCDVCGEDMSKYNK